MSSVKNVSQKTSKTKIATSSSSSRVLKTDEPKDKSKPNNKKLLEEKEVKKNTQNLSKRLVNATVKSISTTSKLKSTNATSQSNKPKTKPSSTSRVQKSQYFPSKNLYSNTLKSLELKSSPDKPEKSDLAKRNTVKVKETSKASVIEPKTSSVDQKKTTTTQKTRNPSPNTSQSTLERPRTATLRKGSIVNANIVGPEAPTGKQDEETYEDDFESYESDFEAESSSTTSALLASEGSLSSSSEDDTPEKPIPSKRLSSAESDERKLDSGTFELSDFKHRQILKYIEDTVKKEDAILEDSKQEKCNHNSLSDEGFEDHRSLQFINFADAKKKCDQKKASATRKKRGEELLGMIKLDAMSFTIFDSPSVPYEVFIKSYGQCCAVQASVQTGEDWISDEVQTISIEVMDKWTQVPCKFTSFDSSREGFWGCYQMELNGVGCEDSPEVKVEYNENRLGSFLERAGDVILQILSEETIASDHKVSGNGDSELIFSKGHMEFNIHGVSKLRESSVQYIAMDSTNPRRVLTVHFSSNLELSRSLLCLWDIVNLDSPLLTFESFGQISCAFFHFNHKYLIAGQHDGSVAVWCTEDTPNRVPTFITPIGAAHLSSVISLQMIEISKEVCSLDQLGKIIIWALYTKDQVVLINTQVINLPEVYQQFTDFTCTDCFLTDNQLYVSTNFGTILHCTAKGTHCGIKLLKPETPNEATCLESCPFSSAYFLTGYSNGDVTLHSRNTEKPLLVLQDKDETQCSSVQIIQWSKTKPFLFYVKDSRNQIHIWDLGKSDMYPEYSIKFPEEICCFRLSPQINMEGREETAYMVIGTVEGNLYMHLLSKEHGKQGFKEYKQDVAVFLNYASRL